MIDTDKYEGHVLVDGKWVKHIMSQEEYDATKALIKDAPLLLEEVKRLREELALYRQGVIDATLMYPDTYNYLPLYLRELIE